MPNATSTPPAASTPTATPVASTRARPAHITPLPADLRPPRSSTELITEHVERMKAAGIPQKVLGLSLGFGPNFVSMLKKGEELPLPRVIAFAKAARLTPTQQHELLHARVMELHGGRGDFDVEALATWGAELFGPDGDEGRLVGMWRDAVAPAPHLLGELLEDPARAARVAKFLNDLVQEELRDMQAE